MTSMILIKSPNGKTEEHTPENAADLRRNAGWKVVGPKVEKTEEDVKSQPKQEAEGKKEDVKKVEPKADKKVEPKADKKEEVKKAPSKK